MAQSRNEIYTAFENIYPVLQEFRNASSGPEPAAEPDYDSDNLEALIAKHVPADAPAPADASDDDSDDLEALIETNVN